MKKINFKICMKGLTVKVKANNINAAQKLAQSKADKMGKDRIILWVEPEGETRIFYCVVCNINSVDPASGSDACYDCTQSNIR